ncbi:MAG: hypothetical protein VXB74_12185, partial [Deltaproteobacteria bacterium]
ISSQQLWQLRIDLLCRSLRATEWIVPNELSEASASAARKQTAVRWKPETIRVVLKNSCFKDNVVKTNAVQILKQAGLDIRSL